MTLKQLEAFVCVSKYKSFSEAAKHLYFTQPTISAHINSLEDELGVNLIKRNTKSVEITSMGNKLLPIAIKMLELQKEIYRDISSQDILSNSKIKISASSIPSEYILPNILTLFKKTYPDIEYELKQTSSLEVAKDILSEDADIGFIGSVIDKRLLTYVPFFDDNLVVLTPNTKFYKNLDNNFPIDLIKTTPLILRDDSSGTGLEIKKILKKQGVDKSELKIVATYQSWDAIKQSVVKGMGITIASSLIAENEIKKKKLLMFPFINNNVSRKINIVYRTKRKLNINEKLLIQFVKGYYG